MKRPAISLPYCSALARAKLSPTLLAFLASVALGFEQATSGTQVTKENVQTFYAKDTRLTTYPHYVAPLTATLCRMPSIGLVEEEKRQTGPHYKMTVHIYPSPLAEDVLTRGVAPIPEGAVIVKEKLGPNGAVTGIGGMIKRAPGYNSEHGDWEFFYTVPEADFSSGRLQNCIDCHAKANSADYTFRSWKSIGAGGLEFKGKDHPPDRTVEEFLKRP